MLNILSIVVLAYGIYESVYQVYARYSIKTKTRTTISIFFFEATEKQDGLRQRTCSSKGDHAISHPEIQVTDDTYIAVDDKGENKDQNDRCNEHNRGNYTNRFEHLFTIFSKNKVTSTFHKRTSFN
jgi:hypothetical protein